MSRNKLYLNSSENNACKDDFHIQSDNTLSHFMLQKLGKSGFISDCTLPCLLL